MVQRKVTNNKIGIQAYHKTIKTEQKQDNTKPSLQNNHDGNMGQGAEVKAIKMKKSRSIEISLRQSPKRGHDMPRRPGKPPPCVTASLKKPSSSKSPCTSPNYMRSTSSFEARKEEAAKVSSITSSSKLHKVAKTLSRTSSFKVVRTLSKAPSFKHCTRTKTCSSTLKDAKFPPYLKLKPGATEAEGRSVQRVCRYNHCSLNGDHHNRAPPLKRFMSSRRRLLKTLKVNRTEILPPRKAKISECKGRGVGDQNEDFFVEIHVPDRGVDTQVSESLSDGPCSEIDQSEDTNLSYLNFCPTDEYYPPTPVQSYLEVESSPIVSLDEFFCETSDREWEDEQICTTNDYGEIYVQSNHSNDQGKPDFEKGSSVDEYLEEFYEYPPYFNDEIVEYLCFSDADSLPDSESTQTGERNIQNPFLVEEKDEINSGPNNEVAEEDSTQAEEATVHAAELENESADEQSAIISDLVEKLMEAQNEDLDSYQEPVETDGDESNEDNGIIAEIKEEDSTQAEEATAHAAELENESADKQGAIISDLVEKIMEAQNEDLDSYQEPVETDGDESNEDNYINAEIREENSADPVMEERQPIEEITDIPRITEHLETFVAKEGICTDNNDDRDGTDQCEDVAALAGQKETEATAANCVSTRSENSEDESENLETSDAMEGVCMDSNDDQDGTDQSEDVAALAGQKETEAAADNCVITRSENSEDESDNLETSDAKEGTCMDNNDDRDGTDQSEDVAAFAGQKETEAAANNCVSIRSENSEDESDSSEVKLDTNENNFEEDKAAGMEDSNRTEEASKCNSNNGESDANQELLDSCNKLKRGMRCKKADEDDEEREFNPRGPNFLDIEPDPEAEKVDLRHQEMDDRRNAEEWMLDHALQKTVNQLTPARKKKVALLVEAFEAVLPVPKDESSMRKNSSGFDHERPIQACNEIHLQQHSSS